MISWHAIVQYCICMILNTVGTRPVIEEITIMIKLCLIRFETANRGRFHKYLTTMAKRGD